MNLEQIRKILHGCVSDEDKQRLAKEYFSRLNIYDQDRLANEIIQSGEIDLVDFLKARSKHISYDFQISEDRMIYGTILTGAIVHGKTEIVASLLAEHEFGLECREEQDPLRLAIEMGQSDIAKLLIDNGAVVNERYQNGNLPLHAAINAGLTAVAELLVDRGANLRDMDGDGFFPLHIAIGRSAVEIAKMLISKGADLNLVCGGMTPLEMALDLQLDYESDPELNPELLLQKKAITELMLAECGGINGRMANGDTLLHKYVSLNNFNVVKFLISRGADVNAVGSHGATPLHFAAYFLADSTIIESDVAANFEITKLLVSSGANVNAKDAEGSYPLQKTYNYEKCKFLIESGAVVEGSKNLNYDFIGMTEKNTLTLLTLHGGISLYQLRVNRYKYIVKEILDSISDDIFAKEKFTRDDLVQIQFLARNRFDDEIVERFRDKLEEYHEFTKFLNDFGNVYVFNDEKFSFVIENKDNPLVGRVLNGCGWYGFYLTIKGNIEEVKDILNNPGLTAEEKGLVKAELEKSCSDFLKAGCYGHADLAINAATILSLLETGAFSCDGAVSDGIQYLIDNDHTNYLVERLRACKIEDALKIFEGLSDYYIRHRGSEIDETYKKIAPLADYLIERIEHIHEPEMLAILTASGTKFILTAYLLHKEEYELVDKLIDKSYFNVDDRLDIYNLPSQMAFNGDVWALEYLIEKGAKFFTGADFNNPIISAAQGSSQEALELLVNLYSSQALSAILSEKDVPTSELGDYAVGSYEAGKVQWTNLESFLDYLKKIDFITVQEYSTICPPKPHEVFVDVSVTGAVQEEGAAAGAGTGGGEA